MKEQILSVHCYAAVELDGKRYLHMANRNKKIFHFEMIDGFGVRIVGDRTTILVPFSNIASVQIAHEEVVEEEDKAPVSRQEEIHQKKLKLTVK